MLSSLEISEDASGIQIEEEAQVLSGSSDIVSSSHSAAPVAVNLHENSDPKMLPVVSQSLLFENDSKIPQGRIHDTRKAVASAVSTGQETYVQFGLFEESGGGGVAEAVKPGDASRHFFGDIDTLPEKDVLVVDVREPKPVKSPEEIRETEWILKNLKLCCNSTELNKLKDDGVISEEKLDDLPEWEIMKLYKLFEEKRSELVELLGKDYYQDSLIRLFSDGVIHNKRIERLSLSELEKIKVQFLQLLSKIRDELGGSNPELNPFEIILRTGNRIQ